MTQSAKPSVAPASIRAGDVFLSLGRGDLSAGIHQLDGGDYSHAALWSGDAVIEATLPVVREVPLKELTQRSEYVDVYRPVKCRSPEAPVAAGRRYVKRPYGSVNLAICTLATTVTSWLPGDWSKLNVLLELGEMGQLIELVSELTRGATQMSSVTCVELVGRAFADSGFPLTIRLDNPGTFNGELMVKAVRDLARKIPKGAISSGSPQVPEQLAWLEQLATRANGETNSRSSEWKPAREGWMGFLREQSGATEQPLTRGKPVVPQRLEVPVAEIRAMDLLVGVDWPPALLTPRLLQSSPSLMFIGRLAPS